jgi:hypothetical protein
LFTSASSRPKRHDGVHQARQRGDVEQVGGEACGGVLPQRVQLGRQGSPRRRRGAIVDCHVGARRVQRARDLGADAAGGAGDQDNGGIRHAGSIPARTRAAAAKPKLAVTATEEP